MYVFSHEFKDFKENYADFNKTQEVKFSLKSKEIEEVELKL